MKLLLLYFLVRITDFLKMVFSEGESHKRTLMPTMPSKLAFYGLVNQIYFNLRLFRFCFIAILCAVSSTSCNGSQTYFTEGK